MKPQIAMFNFFFLFFTYFYSSSIGCFKKISLRRSASITLPTLKKTDFEKWVKMVKMTLKTLNLIDCRNPVVLKGAYTWEDLNMEGAYIQYTFDKGFGL